MFNKLLIAALFGFALLVVIPGAVFAQTTVTVESDATSASAETVDDSNTAGQIADAAELPNLNIVLLGELVGMDEKDPAKGPFPDLAGFTTSTLGGTVTDLTTAGLTIEQVVEQAESQVTGAPDVAIAFLGYTDQQNETTDTEQRSSLVKLTEVLRKHNPSMRVFFIPASTEVGAITSANMLLAASSANATFVSIGTEVAGQPYLDALQEVKAELASATSVAEDSQPQPEEPSKSVTIRGTGVETSTRDNASYETEKATLQQELERIAGQSGEAAQSFPSLADTATTSFVDSNTTGIPYPAGGTMTKHGAEAKEGNIKMKPLPAVKAFRPQIPVPRNQVNEKEPAVSR